MSLYTKIIDRQKLGMAWAKVKSNKPAAGVDGVTYEDFDVSLKENLAQLNAELLEHRYQSQPVKMTILHKGEKERAVSLYTMRDKVVQQTIAAELVKIYDSQLSDAVYAYRPGRSALQAVELLEREIQKPTRSWILKTDISSFFDTIVLQKLYDALRPAVREQDVIDLIQACCEAKQLQKNGELVQKIIGVYQGSGIAPVLSNVYLMEFDREMEEKFGGTGVYVRYSDDMIVLGESRENMVEALEFMRIRLKALGLSLNEDKTAILAATDGVSFLGYHLSSSGAAIPVKAEENLQQRLEKVWMGSDKTAEKLQKGAEILNGWEQYFRGERTIASIEEFTVVVYMVQGKPGGVPDTVRECRWDLVNIYPEICRYLATVWKNSDPALELFEYEQLFGLEKLDRPVIKGKEGAFTALCEDLLIRETRDTWTELMQLYSDEGLFNKASKIMERIQQIEAGEYVETSLPDAQAAAGNDDHGDVFDRAAEDDGFVQAFLQTFAGREDTFGREEINAGRRRCVEQAAEPLTEEVIRAHLKGEYAVSTYVQRSNSTVRFLVIDLDVSRKYLLEEGTDAAVRNHMPNAVNAAAQMLRLLKRLGLTGYPEFSGYRGFHIWVFFTEWIPTRYVNMLTDVIESQWEEQHADLTIEFFPNKGRLRNGSPGQCIKLPYGIHIRSGKHSMLLDERFREIEPDQTFLKELAQFSRQAVKRIIGTHVDENDLRDSREVNRDLQEFGEIPESVRVVLDHCNLMRYLCQKSRTTGYLSHFERLSVLYVFGHLGEEGKQFVHTVMEFTLNYKYHVTERFINRLPAKPVSCMKLRDQYQQITAEYGCSCNFKRTKNCYPSPVLHAIKTSGDLAGDVTIPTSKSISKEKEKQVIEELNIHKKVEELAGKIVEMKKQKRGIDRNIQKTEKELEALYDQAGVDALEVSMGVMVRRKTQTGYEWLIEI